MLTFFTCLFYIIIIIQLAPKIKFVGMLFRLDLSSIMSFNPYCKIYIGTRLQLMFFAIYWEQSARRTRFRHPKTRWKCRHEHSVKRYILSNGVGQDNVISRKVSRDWVKARKCWRGWNFCKKKIIILSTNDLYKQKNVNLFCWNY